MSAFASEVETEKMVSLRAVTESVRETRGCASLIVALLGLYCYYALLNVLPLMSKHRCKTVLDGNRPD